MQDKYVGDLGDFGKYILLNRIAEESGGKIRLGINWYYTTIDEGANTDGNHIGYLTQGNKSWASFRECAPALHALLGKIVASSRTVAEIEKSDVLPNGTQFFSQAIPLPRFNNDRDAAEDRESWLTDSTRVLIDTDIIFLDPDNGILPIRASKSSPTAVKYVFSDEIEKYYRLGKSLVIYNHRDRRPTEEYEAKILLTRKIVKSWGDIKVLRFKRGSVRDYIFLVQNKHRALFKRVFNSLTSSPLDFMFEEYPLLTEKNQKTPGKWTNPSVVLFAGKANPVERIEQQARELVVNALDKGWAGPPYNPFDLAKILGIETVPNERVIDGQTVPIRSKKGRIEYNPNRSKGRIRFSIAHEIAHSIFPDCYETVRQRHVHSARKDNWQLELLCNVAAAEILMPVGTGEKIEQENVTISNIIDLQRKYDVSTEAISIRLTSLTQEACTLFVASRRDDSKARYRIDYSVLSPTSSLALDHGFVIPEQSLLSECVAIGYTAKGSESWFGSGKPLAIECIGIPPFPNNKWPRIVGIAKSWYKAKGQPKAIRSLVGDATAPRGAGKRIIAHIVNDKTPNWGAGFPVALKEKWPHIQAEFKSWAESDRSNLALGNSFISKIDKNISVFHMIAQHGYGPSPKPRLRYSSLKSCLDKLAETALARNASVHMPRIGSGQAGGNWSIIRELIHESLVRSKVNVTVYDLPGTTFPPEHHGEQSLLFT